MQEVTLFDVFGDSREEAKELPTKLLIILLRKSWKASIGDWIGDLKVDSFFQILFEPSDV